MDSSYRTDAPIVRNDGIPTAEEHNKRALERLDHARLINDPRADESKMTPRQRFEHRQRRMGKEPIQ
jgi:hypothetical protein